MKRAQRGAGAVFIVIVLVIAALVVLAVGAFVRSSNAVSDLGQSTAHLAAAAAALDQFAGASGRLPCPADPAADTGDEVRAGPSFVTCTYPQGTLPWRTIGMRRDDSFDPWGWKISYRVWTNSPSGVGSFTQDNGASMVNCDTVQALSLRQPLDGSGLCPAAHDTTDAYFVAGTGIPEGKGLVVVDFGTQYDATKTTGGAAYVLISHGPTGLGAYTASGAQQPLPTSADELSNTAATGPFVAKAASSTDVSAGDATHFDDLLLYRTVTDLAKRANLAARDWYDDVLEGVKFDTQTLANALGSAPGSDTGHTSITFAGVTVTAFNSGTAGDISFSTSGGNEGIGEAGGGSNSLGGLAGEGIRIALTQTARKFAVTLKSFRKSSYFGTPYAEQVQLNFLKGGVTVDGVTKQACSSVNAVASYSVTAAADFDTVEIKALPATLAFLDSRFYVSEFASCAATAASCTTTLATVGNTCP